MSDPLSLARPELLSIAPYVPGVYEPGMIRLNANESPWRAPADRTDRGLNIYPPPRPDSLRDRLAEHYGISRSRLLMTRGSSEAIDVLIRGFCSARRDKILITPPTFDMYRLYATIQDAGIVQIPLRREDDYSIDVAKIVARADDAIKLVFLCSPNNPTGTSIPHEDVERICNAFENRALVVIDEAYHEFADAADFGELLERHRHVVLLRTLSKFMSLAGARCGTLMADIDVVEFLERVLPPYTYPTPSIELIEQALTEDSLAVSHERIATIKIERRKMSEALRNSPLVTAVYPSDANFLLIDVLDSATFSNLAHRAGILVRTFTNQPELVRSVRITIGRPQDNDRLLRAISGTETSDDA